jgi:hypothetical protein
MLFVKSFTLKSKHKRAFLENSNIFRAFVTSGSDINTTTRSSRELLVDEKLLDSNYYENKKIYLIKKSNTFKMFQEEMCL